MTRRCSHNPRERVEVTIDWCGSCQQWRYVAELVSAPSHWAGASTRQVMKTAAVPLEDTTPDETFYLFQSLSELARNAKDLL